MGLDRSAFDSLYLSFCIVYFVDTEKEPITIILFQVNVCFALFRFIEHGPGSVLVKHTIFLVDLITDFIERFNINISLAMGNNYKILGLPLINYISVVLFMFLDYSIRKNNFFLTDSFDFRPAGICVRNYFTIFEIDADINLLALKTIH